MAGPINWFLSLRAWKLPARLSYGVYLLHYPLIFLSNSSAIHSHYFSVSESVSIRAKILGLRKIQDRITGITM